MPLLMWPQTVLDGRTIMRAILGLTAAYMLTLVFAFTPSSAQELLVVEGMFAGPIIFACALTMIMTRIEARRLILGFQVAYIVASLVIGISTFSGERDAQYQLQLLLIPLVGFSGVTVAGVLAAFRR